ncbi:MAG TPA: DUF92 domain-containing protein [Thermoplasmata archaeon]|nr:DUF92 domain-containing protein [Thermoplasmata archaeon]
MVLSLLPAFVASMGTVALALGAIFARALTPTAGAVAAAFGIVIVVTVGYPFLILLILFVVASVLATQYRIDEKSKKHLQEGAVGERGVSNVLAHIIVPTGLAVAMFASPSFFSAGAVLYASALAFGASDTFASELGVLAGRARSILTLRPVPPGTNGGVSLAGHLWGFLGALTTGVLSALLFWAFGTVTVSPLVVVGVATAAGFLACQVDSVLGETLENRGYLTKGTTNLAAMLASVALAAGFLELGGWVR